MSTHATIQALDDQDFELDITIVDAGPVIPELMRSTSDNCGGTCATACTSCKTDSSD
jgi:FxLD family lantipeptide